MNIPLKSSSSVDNSFLSFAARDDLDNVTSSAIAEHFELLHHLAARSGHKGNLVLAAFRENLPAKAMHFAIGDHVGMATAAMAFQDTGYNVYAPLGVYRADLASGSKGSESDVVALLGAVI